MRAAVQSVQRISADQDTRHANPIKFKDRHNDFVRAVRDGLEVDRTKFEAGICSAVAGNARKNGCAEHSGKNRLSPLLLPESPPGREVVLKTLPDSPDASYSKALYPLST